MREGPWQSKRRSKPHTQRGHDRGHAEGPRFERRSGDAGDGVILYGWHSVTAALANPARRIRKLFVTENALRRLTEENIPLPLAPDVVRPGALAARLTPDAVHQGLLAEADPLPSPGIEDLADNGIVLVLDQITDPHNVGAIMRTAAAFAVEAIVTTARHSPEATGVLAKAASGALELVPIAIVQNLARALAALKERGFLVVGLEFKCAGRSRDNRTARAARARARRRGQGVAAIDRRDLRPAGAAWPSGRDQEPQRLECRRACALHRLARVHVKQKARSCCGPSRCLLLRELAHHG